MTSTMTTPEHLAHLEHGTAPFTAVELAGIAEYELHAHTGTDGVGPSEMLYDVTAESLVGDTPEDTPALVRMHFGWLSDWYGHLDGLKSALRNTTGGPANSTAATRYLQRECTWWYRTLNLVRREACRVAYGTVGPQPEVDAGWLTFFDIPGVLLDGTVVAENL